jgi:hypothetical protein
MQSGSTATLKASLHCGQCAHFEPHSQRFHNGSQPPWIAGLAAECQAVQSGRTLRGEDEKYGIIYSTHREGAGL